MIIFGPKLVNFLRFAYDIFISGRSSYSRVPDKRGWGRIKVLRIVPTPGRYQDRLLVFGLSRAYAAPLHTVMRRSLCVLKRNHTLTFS